MTETSLRLARLARMSHWLSQAAKLVALLLLAANAAMWLIPGFAADAARTQSALTAAAPVTLTLGARLAALAVSTLYVGLMAAALMTVAQIFAAFAKNAIFVPETGTRLRRVGALLLLYALLSPVFRGVIGVIVTIANEPGHRQFSIGISSQDVIVALIAALLIVLGHVMAEAARIAEDHQHIV